MKRFNSDRLKSIGIPPPNGNTKSWILIQSTLSVIRDNEYAELRYGSTSREGSGFGFIFR